MPVYKDKQRGTWYITVRSNGKQIKRRGFQTKAEAVRQEALLLIDKPHARLTVTTLTDDYINYKDGRIKQSTLYTYREYVEKFIKPYFGNQSTASIGYKEAEQFMDYLRRQGYSANYCNHVFGFARSLWQYGIRFHSLDTNPFTLVERPKQAKTLAIHTWSPEEFSRFYKAVSSRRAQIMFLTMYWTGIRKGEMRGLQWTDFDYASGVLHITKQYSRHGGIVAPKTDSAERSIDLPLFLADALHGWYTEQAGIEGFSDDWFMFGDKEPIGLNTIAWWWKKGIKESGLPAIHIHDLRHSHASWLFANKFDTAYISHRLGHSSIAITLQTYTHLMNDVAQRERERLCKICAMPW